MTVRIIEDRHTLALATEIRSESTENVKLKELLFQLGYKIGIEIVSENLLTTSDIITPMKHEFRGYMFNNTTNIIYSTKDDYEYFAKGISSAIPNSMMGYLDFQGVRGVDALTQPIRSASHPIIKHGTTIDTIIIAKAVLATGCTAISLAKNILGRYHPKNLVIASVYYSEMGIHELLSEIPSIKNIYTVGNPDKLNEHGMLIPGVGNLDARLSS
jgi:uracil phosphoribosyltransferase